LPPTSGVGIRLILFTPPKKKVYTQTKVRYPFVSFFLSIPGSPGGRGFEKGGGSLPFSPTPARRSVPLLVVLLGKGRLRKGAEREGEKEEKVIPPLHFKFSLDLVLCATCPHDGLPTPLLEASQRRPKRGGRPHRSKVFAVCGVFAPSWSTLHKHPLSSGPSLFG
jgi:hypothetical protein